MTAEDIEALLAKRNAANDNTPPLYGSKPRSISLTEIKSYLKAVKRGDLDDYSIHETPVASFCGAAGLVKIRGRFAELTEQGRAVA